MGELNLGQAIRHHRERQGRSLRALAARTGLSASFLSQVENGSASPSIASMERIATELGLSLGQFFSSAEGSGGSVLRQGERGRMVSEWSKAQVEVLVPPGSRQGLAPIVVTLEPGGSSGKRASPAPLEEFALLLGGRVELVLGTAPQQLDVGDSVIISAGADRVWRNQSDAPASILIVARVAEPGQAE